MLSNEEHNELLSKQFLLERFRRDHPCSHMLEAIPPQEDQENVLKIRQ